MSKIIETGDEPVSISLAGGVAHATRGAVELSRIAIDLSLVARLEEFPRDAVEIAADQEVVQYRGQIMPLIHVSDVL